MKSTNGNSSSEKRHPRRTVKRSSGVLMHISSLFGGFSCGSFGDAARYFIDFLKESGFSWWQVLPFCPTDEYSSPYKSLCSFGGNPMFIDLPTLYEQGLLTAEELRGAVERSPYLVESERLNERIGLLSLACSRMENRKEVYEFLSSHPESALAAEFMARRSAEGGLPWQRWRGKEPNDKELFLWQFIQYEFFSQWKKIRAYANSHGIRIIGDLPIYVSEDSADVWAHGDEFLLDNEGYPTEVAGVPPDYFSEDGQLWGNPLYNWEKMKENGYAWWRRRIAWSMELFDGVRIDHFRGLEAYWSIPRGAESAKEGRWVEGPGREMVDAIRAEAGEGLVIAEDLGDITDGVRDLLDYSGLPGMRVLQFGFLSAGESIHLPHNYSDLTVAYSGTHDNNTLLGFIWESDEENRRRLFDYIGADTSDLSSGVSTSIRTLYASAAPLAILPVQDLLGYGSDTRMNTPGRAKGNWLYRITKEQLDGIDRKRFAYLAELFGRKP